MRPYRSKSPFVPIYRIENKFPTLQSILDEFGVSSIEEINVWGVDLGEVNTAAFCRILRTDLTSIDTNMAPDDDAGPEHPCSDQVSTNSILPPSWCGSQESGCWQKITFPADICPSTKNGGSIDNEDHRQSRPDDRGQAMGRAEGRASGWTNVDSEHQRDPGRAAIPTLSTNCRLGAIYAPIFPCSRYLSWILWVCKSKAMDWDLKKAKKAEMDLAINAILSECATKTLLCYGDGSFRTGINLASPQETFKAVLHKRYRCLLLLSLFPVSCVCLI
ncbi:MAG: hypothetical protein J3R72DRAFT_213788 [Linnemannia gamsii]|nr:MAG: hypothetical protein J3R72DRAFT_213788 [Linnemannia gamsii]